ncbi:MAG: hypothetical protein ACLQBD_30340 [Syntrophobacteraceae bacterium]
MAKRLCRRYVGELKSLVDGSKVDGSIGSAESVNGKEGANGTGKNSLRTTLVSEMKAKGHSRRDNGKDLSNFKKTETQSEQVIPFNDSDF